MFQQYCCVFLHEFANTKNEHIVTKFSDIHILRDNILDFVWTVFVLQNYKRLVSWPSARAIIWAFLAPTMFTIVPYSTLTVHAQFLPTLLVRSIHAVNYHFSQHLALLKRQRNNALEMLLSVKTLFFITT